MNRRGFLSGLAGCFAAAAAPGVVGSGILMPVRSIVLPPALLLEPEDITITISEYAKHWPIGEVDELRRAMQDDINERSRQLLEVVRYGVVMTAGGRMLPRDAWLADTWGLNTS